MTNRFDVLDNIIVYLITFLIAYLSIVHFNCVLSAKKKRKQYTWRKDPTKRRWNDTPPSVNTELFPRCIPLVRSVYVRIIYITPTISFQLAQQPTLSLLVCICICTRIYVYIYIIYNMYIYISILSWYICALHWITWKNVFGAE